MLELAFLFPFLNLYLFNHQIAYHRDCLVYTNTVPTFKTIK